MTPQEQKLKCEQCEYKILNNTNGWCYMFEEMFISCKKFKQIKCEYRVEVLLKMIFQA